MSERPITFFFNFIYKYNIILRQLKPSARAALILLDTLWLLFSPQPLSCEMLFELLFTDSAVGSVLLLYKKSIKERSCVCPHWDEDLCWYVGICKVAVIHWSLTVTQLKNGSEQILCLEWHFPNHSSSIMCYFKLQQRSELPSFGWYLSIFWTFSLTLFLWFYFICLVHEWKFCNFKWAIWINWGSLAWSSKKKGSPSSHIHPPGNLSSCQLVPNLNFAALKTETSIEKEHNFILSKKQLHLNTSHFSAKKKKYIFPQVRESFTLQIFTTF